MVVEFTAAAYDQQVRMSVAVRVEYQALHVFFVFWAADEILSCKTSIALLQVDLAGLLERPTDKKVFESVAVQIGYTHKGPLLRIFLEKHGLKLIIEEHGFLVPERDPELIGNIRKHAIRANRNPADRPLAGQVCAGPTFQISPGGARACPLHRSLSERKYRIDRGVRKDCHCSVGPDDLQHAARKGGNDRPDAFRVQAVALKSQREVMAARRLVMHHERRSVDIVGDQVELPVVVQVRIYGAVGYRGLGDTRTVRNIFE